MNSIKKATAAVICVIILSFSFLTPAFAADTFQKDCANAAYDASAAVVYDLTNDVVIYEKNPTKQIRVASMTKVLTACVAAQYFKAGDYITVGYERNLVKSYASVAGIYRGETYTFEQLLYAMLLPSGCDAAYTLAAATAKKASKNSGMSASDAVAYFVKMMDTFAKEELGCTDSHFVNPDGQDVQGVNQHTTARDYIKVGVYALSHELISKVISNYKYSCRDKNGGSHTWYTTNYMLNPGSSYYCKNGIGIKTGSTPYAGYCLMFAQKREGRVIVSIVCGTSSGASRFTTTRKLHNIAYDHRIPGDANVDLAVTSEDARLVLRISVGLDKLEKTQLKYVDMDSDGSITSSDARTILRMAVGLK